MSIKIITDRLLQFKPENKREELNAIKEIAQEITLIALSRTHFFKQGAFLGGTCLRIVHGLARFSEDLDFALFKPDADFKWFNYFEEIVSEFSSYGLTLEITDRSEANSTVKKAFLKENSFGKILIFHYEHDRADQQKILIKLEIDTNPPKGCEYANAIIDFPRPFSIITPNLPISYIS